MHVLWPKKQLIKNFFQKYLVPCMTVDSTVSKKLTASIFHLNKRLPIFVYFLSGYLDRILTCPLFSDLSREKTNEVIQSS